MSEFSEHVSIVTGATRGIGRSIAERLCRDGATVVGVGREGEQAPALLAVADRDPHLLPRELRDQHVGGLARRHHGDGLEQPEVAVLVGQGALGPAAEGVAQQAHEEDHHRDGGEDLADGADHPSIVPRPGCFLGLPCCNGPPEHPPSGSSRMGRNGL